MQEPKKDLEIVARTNNDAEPQRCARCETEFTPRVPLAASLVEGALVCEDCTREHAPALADALGLEPAGSKAETIELSHAYYTGSGVACGRCPQGYMPEPVGRGQRVAIYWVTSKGRIEVCRACGYAVDKTSPARIREFARSLRREMGLHS